MFESRNRLFASACALTLASIALAGCSATEDGDPMPPPPSTIFKAEFNPAVARMPYPIDLYFSGSTDGTLATVPSSAQGYPRSPATAAALNSLDGWSTTADITASFNQPINPASIGAATVRVVEMYLSNTTKGPAQGAELPPGVASPVRRVLAYGTDFTASVSQDIDSEGRFLKITPLKPLQPSTGAINTGYLIILTTGLVDVQGRTAQPDDLYAAIKVAPADCSSFTDPTQNGVCRLVKGQLAIAGAVGVTAANVILTWSFTTQSIDDTFNVIAATVPGNKPTVINIGQTTQNINPALAGKAAVYTGSMQVPYYLTAAANNKDTAPNTQFWTAAGPSTVPGIDPASRNLTRFNPVPRVTSVQTIPVLVTVPNSSAAGGACGSGATPPPGGWPVVVVQHGLGGNRTDALAMADSYADACMVVIAIDAPLHGLTPATGGALYCSTTTPNPICAGATERTFDLDLVAPLGTVDPSATHFNNLASPATGRDNYRQTEADLIVLEKSVLLLDLDGDGTADVNPNLIHYTGLSLGGIVGGAHVPFNPDLASVTLSVPGGRLTDVLKSPRFFPTVQAALSGSLVQDSYAWNLWFRDGQAILDPADPINHINDAVSVHPIYIQKVTGDTVVPNSTTDALINAVVAPNTITRVSSGTTPVSPGNGVWVEFPYGHHGSLFTPAPCAGFPAAAQALCVATTTEMQRQAVTFAASAAVDGGPFLTVSNPGVVKP